MNPVRRRWLAALTSQAALTTLAAGPAPARAGGVQRGRALAFPRDHGAHLEARTEWWYATGWRGTQAAPTEGFQVTFFRSRTGLAEGLSSRFAARQLLFAHAAVTQLSARSHRHDQRIVRWSGAPDAGGGAAASDGGGVHIGDWSLRDDGAAWQVAVPARDFALQFALTRTQPLLLQGEAGWSRKGPDMRQASHYYSEPQLAVAGGGRAWLDHEWSDELLHPEAVGWDWTGMNLFDGTALTAFRLRRRDGSVLWAGGSVRRPGAAVQAFEPAEVRFTPGRSWTSPGSGARYPVEWQIETPAGAFGLRSLLDAQELDSRAGTGTVYWEGLSELLDAQGRRVGLGYLEMTGYAGMLKL